jgi:hypothetical protein
MTLLTRRGVLLEQDGQSTLAESDADAEEARTLRPLQAGAVTHRFRPARRTQGADPERGDAARGRSALAPVRRRRRVQPACCGPSRSTRSQAAGAVDGLALQRCSRGGGCAPCPASGPSTGSRPGSRPAAARSPAAFTPGCVRKGAFASCGLPAHGACRPCDQPWDGVRNSDPPGGRAWSMRPARAAQRSSLRTASLSRSGR